MPGKYLPVGMKKVMGGRVIRPRELIHNMIDVSLKGPLTPSPRPCGSNDAFHSWQSRALDRFKSSYLPLREEMLELA